MPPFLSDERIEDWEDPADRIKLHEDVSVEYPHQVICRHSWEDGKRKHLERHGFRLLELVNSPGEHALGDKEFRTLAEFVYDEQPKPLRRALKSGLMSWGKVRVVRVAQSQQEAAA